MRCNPLRWLWGIIPLIMLAWIAALGEHERIEADLSKRTKEALSKAKIGSWAVPSFTGRDGRLAGVALEEGDPAKAIEAVRGVRGVRIIEDRTRLLEKADKFVWSASRQDDRIRLTGFVPGGKARADLLGMIKAEFPGAKVEDKLEDRRGAPIEWLGGASFALQQLKHLKSGQADLDGVNLSVTGEALTPRAFRTVTSSLEGNLPRGIKLREAKVKAPVIRPYTWGAKLAGKEVVLTGHVPSTSVRNDLINAIKGVRGDIQVADQTDFAEGAPAAWPQAAIVALRELGRLESGSIEMRDAAVAFEGMAVQEATAVSVRDTLKGRIAAPFKLTETIRFREPTIRPVSPFITLISVDRGNAMFGGYVPTAAERASLSEAIRARFAGVRLTDSDVAIAAGAAPTWRKCIDAGLAALGQLGGGTLRLTDRGLEIDAATSDEALYERVPGQVREAVGRDCTADVRIAYTPPPEPSLSWRATYDKARRFATLEGDVPDAATRQLLGQQAPRILGVENVIDRMTVREGYAKNWAVAALESLKMLSGLRMGEARLVNQDLTISGEAPDVAIQTGIRGQIGRLPRGYRGVEQVSVRSDAMIATEEQARRRAAEEEARQRAEADAKRRAEDEAKRRADEEARQRAATAAAAEAKRKADEEARQRAVADAEARNRAELEAKQRSEAEARKRAADASAAAAAAEAARQKQLLAQRCQDDLRAAAKAGVIRFKFASAELEAASQPTLKKLVQIANACPGVRIDVEGHTDTDGAPDRNQRLSERRAKSVVEYLTKAGLAQDRLQAIGLGQERPVAPNDTPANKQLNRRIEFTVRAN